MAVPVDAVRFSMRGKLAVTDQWNCSFWMTPVGANHAPSTAADATTLLNTFTTGTAWTNFRAALLAMQRPIDGIQQEALYCYPSGGTSATAQAIKTDVGAGTGTSATLPPQICRVVTLRTDLSGRRHRGRIYLPATGMAVDSTNEQFSDSGSTLLTALEAWDSYLAELTEGWWLAVVSQTSTSSQVVARFSTDTVADTQRRRRNKVVAATVTNVDFTP